MCGFAGFWHPGRGQSYEGATVLARMSDAIRHRGPDDHGAWSNDEGLFLGHRRLSVLDLSEAGHQPMTSPSQRFVVVYNGEIYNFQALRDQLDAEMGPLPWRGHSDTEVMLAGFERWGVEATLKRLVGMFALALWDRERRTLTLARDRLGEKPLYYGVQNGVLLFGSELSALRRHPACVARLSRQALALFLKFAYVPAPHSIYEGIGKLPPGSFVEITENMVAEGACATAVPYWQLPVFAAGAKGRSDAEASEELEALLRQAISGQMLADVPLGAFLSGGIDSSLIVALMQAMSRQPVKTFTIGFDNPLYNEAEAAKAVARHLGTDHTEFYVTGEDALNVAPRLAEIYSEPFADSSQIPTWLVSNLARRHVTVSLSGDAGDELFGGYNRYQYLPKIRRRLGALPLSLRALAGKAIGAVPPRRWDAIAAAAGALIPGFNVRLPGDKLQKLAAVMACPSAQAMYDRVVSAWPDAQSVVIGAGEATAALGQVDADFVPWMMRQDILTYLPDDILTKVDRAAMAVSLETRAPFLDHRVVEYAASLPLTLKIREGQSKWILRQLLYRYVPRGIIERPKMGFAIPLHDWLRGPLRDWAAELLSPSRLTQEGYFVPGAISKVWQQHQSGRGNFEQMLWPVLMFQAWKERLV
ncbi:MAG: asparagine synthase (glutamine-hydrolyzing) [Alphaproteobacteria bacterium]|nr:asparagine synthase (glutamine-hydrolyzing) [Alphaproteobacteria bacterium]